MRKAQNQKAEVAGLLAGATDLHKRILFVLGAFIVYRLGTHIPLPGVDAVALTAYQGQLQQGLFGVFNMFSGGALSRMAIFALNIMPYITASIIIQLMTAIYPSLKELKKEGEIGKRKLAQYTRYLTILLAFGQGFGLASGIETQTVNIGAEVMHLVPDAGLAFRLQTALTIMTGTMFLMWLGEQINARGIGNGISLLIFAGIVAELPKALFQTFELVRIGSMGGFLLMGIAVMVVAVLGFIVFMETAQRRVLVQYPKQQAAGGGVGAASQYLPLKVNMAGVIPAIFGSALLLAPLQIASFYPNAAWAQFVGAWVSPGKPLYSVAFVAMIIFFCFFYTANVAFNSKETADNLKQGGGFLPGVRPGEATANFLDFIVTRLTLIGAIYMSFICIMPEIVNAKFNVPFYFGGTSLLIVVSVTIDTVSRIQSYVIAQRYEGLLKKTANRKRRGK